MKRFAILLLILIGLSSCSSAGSLSLYNNEVNYDLPTVVYDKHQAVIYPAGSKRDYR